MSKPTEFPHVALYRLLLQRGRVTTSQVMRQLDVKKETALNWLRGFEARGWVEHVGESRHASWILAPGLDREGLGLLDAIGLRIGRDLVAFASGTALFSALDRSVDGAEERARLPDHLDRKVVCLEEPGRLLDGVQEVLDDLLDGLLRSRLVALAYDGGGVVRRYDRFQPLSLVVYRRGFYMVGRQVGNDKLVRLAVDRVTEARCLDAPFVYPKDWDPSALSRTFGIYDDGRAPERVVLRFPARTARLVRSRRWHPTAEVVEVEGGAVELRMVTHGRELVRFVLEWGPSCRVIEPEWLREAVVSELTAALRQYEITDGEMP